MANVNAPNGFRPFRHGGKRAPFFVARSVKSGRDKDLMPGDAYRVNGDDVIRVTDDGRVSGIVVGIGLNPKTDEGPESQDYIPKDSSGYIIGCEDPDAEFEVQFNSIFNYDNHLGKFYNLFDSDGDTQLAQSRQVLNAATADSISGQFKLTGFIDRVDNDITSENPKVIVRLANPGPVG